MYINAFAAGGFGYIFGIDLRNSTNEFWQFNPVNGTWTKKDDVPYPIFREHANIINLGDKAYLAGGANWFYGCAYDFWEFDSKTEKWTFLSLMPFPIIYTYMFPLNGKIYLGGSSLYSYYGNEYGYMSVYNPKDTTWKRLDPPSNPCAPEDLKYWNYIVTGIPFIEDGVAYLVCAEKGLCINSYKKYDPKTNVWTNLQPVVSSRTDVIGFSIGERGYIGFGKPCTSKIEGAYHSDFYTFGIGMPLIQKPVTGQRETGFDETIGFIQVYDHITLRSKTNDDISVEILDIYGRQIYVSTLPKQESLNISTNEYAAGIYHVRTVGTNPLVKKIIVNQ